MVDMLMLAFDGAHQGGPGLAADRRGHAREVQEHPTKITTRMKTTLNLLLASSVCTALASFAFAVEPPPTKAKVLLIGKQPDHPYGSHMYLHTCRMLAECLRLNGLEAVV